MKNEIKSWMMKNYETLYSLYEGYCIDTKQTTSLLGFEGFVVGMYSECKH